VLSLREYGVVIARFGFGIAWVVAAWLKWQPAFIASYGSLISGSMSGRPALVQAWIGLWANIVHLSPAFFAYSTASIETALALCFILGLFTNAACIVSIILSFLIWSIPQGFGTPYIAGQSTDIGPSFLYIFLALLLMVVGAGRYLGLDAVLTRKLGTLGFLASGTLKKTR
jgi:uncharacterized membrane protein YphA (DoxX/SURF4 family)